MKDEDSTQNKFDSIKEIVSGSNSENVSTTLKAGDSLLIDLVRKYPHLYDKSLPNYKDSLMKENSWKEIAKVMTWSPNDCHIRWIRLRERFSKERRKIEAELKNGSGISKRRDFILYKNMQFLNKHVQRRRTISRVSRNKKNEKGISVFPKTSSTSSNLTISTPPIFVVSQDQILGPISLHSCMQPVDKIKPVGNFEMLNHVETNNEMQSRSESSILETQERPDRCSSRSSASEEFSSHTLPLVQCVYRNKDDGDISTPKKSQNSKSDNIEKSFLTLPATNANKIQNSKMQTISRNEKDAEDKFAELIAVELRNMPEKERNKKKKQITDILWN